jgi:TonB family protein
VVLTPDLGPAVTGLGRGRVVLPRWLWRLGATERRLAVAHEREHLRAGDPWLLAGARLLAALMPWNLPLWWGLRRLRLAVETDCDRRVLRAGADPRAYGDLLLSVGERSRPVRGLAALAERTSFLERRIDQMTRATTKWRGPKAALAGAVALAAVAVACESPTPTADGGDVDRETAPTSISEDVASADSADELPPPSQGGEASDRPAFIPYDVPPKISNPGEVREHLQRAYSEDLREDGVEGRVVLWMYVNADGRVEKVRVQDSSGLDALDEAAKRVGLSMEFKPAMNRDQPTAVWVQQPITFEID